MNGGGNTTTLGWGQMPARTHKLYGSSEAADQYVPTNERLLAATAMPAYAQAANLVQRAKPPRRRRERASVVHARPAVASHQLLHRANRHLPSASLGHRTRRSAETTQVEAFIAEIRIFAGPLRSCWLGNVCGAATDDHGQRGPISLLGTSYGGDGTTTFASPDYRGRIAVGQGTGPGRPPRTLGQRFGAQTVTRTVDQIPVHSHPMMGSSSPTVRESPQASVLATVDGTFYEVAVTADQLVDMPT